MHKMQKIVVENITSLKIDKVWELLTDIKSYPQYMEFVREVKAPKVFKEGVCWSDITNIFWIPLEIKHKIIKIEKNKKFIYELFLPMGGTMMEEIGLTVSGKGTKIHSEIKFTFKNRLVDFVLGSLLKKRLREMLKGTFRNLSYIFKII